MPKHSALVGGARSRHTRSKSNDKVGKPSGSKIAGGSGQAGMLRTCRLRHAGGHSFPTETWFRHPGQSPGSAEDRERARLPHLLHAPYVAANEVGWPVSTAPSDGMAGR